MQTTVYRRAALQLYIMQTTQPTDSISNQIPVSYDENKKFGNVEDGLLSTHYSLRNQKPQQRQNSVPSDFEAVISKRSYNAFWGFAFPLLYYVVFSRCKRVCKVKKPMPKGVTLSHRGGSVCSACVSVPESGPMVTSCNGIIFDHTTLLGITRPTLLLTG